MESYDFIWKAFILVLSGILLLRFAGRKSISQMTLAQTVIMISIGSIIIQPIIETSTWKTLIVSAIFVLTLFIVELLQIKFNPFEKFITGKAKVVIENGQLQIKQLKKIRVTVDQLEMFLRQNGITKISDVKTATMEPNGQLGYELKEDAKPLTVGEFKKLIAPTMLNMNSNNHAQQNQSNNNLFNEINQKNKANHPEKLK